MTKQERDLKTAELIGLWCDGMPVDKAARVLGINRHTAYRRFRSVMGPVRDSEKQERDEQKVYLLDGKEV